VNESMPGRVDTMTIQKSHSICRWLALLVFVAAPVLQATTDIRRDAVVQVVEDVMPSVVNVATESIVESRDIYDELWRRFYGYPRRSEVRSSLGSGVIISDDGYLLTNLHVVKRANRIQVKLSDAAGGGVYDVEEYVGTPTIDVALLKIKPKKTGEKFKAIKFAQDDDLLLGETVVALGNPFGLGESASKGILSSKRRAVPRENEELRMENWLQTDASINPGNSGGPLVDLRGNLIGINVAIYQGAQGIGFAIPVTEVREALADVFNPETAKRWFSGHVSLTPPLVVKKIDSDSPAEEAGLKIGDDILSVNGKPAGDYIEFNRMLRESSKTTIDLSVARNGELRDIHVRMLPFEELFRQRLGVDLQELTGKLVDQLGLGELGGQETGLLVSRVEKGGPAEKASLQKYFVLRKIGNQPVRNYLDAFVALSDLKNGDATKLAVLVPLTRGNVIIGYRNGETELRLR
jgi:serine protease Do